MIKVLQFQLSKAQARMKSQTDRHRTERSFQSGDMVFLKLQPYRQTSISGGRPPKLSPKFFGPFQVLQAVDKVAYKLNLPPEAQIHNVFHVSQLRKAFGQVNQFIPLTMSHNQAKNFETLVIIERKLVKRGNCVDVQLLIH